jgi:hypothetical protein
LIGERRGKRAADKQEKFPEYKGKQNRDIAAKKAGFKNSKT